MTNSVLSKTGATILELIKDKASGAIVGKVSEKMGELMKSFSIGLGGVMKTGQYNKAKIIIYDDMNRPYIIPEVEFHTGNKDMPGNFSYSINVLEEGERDSYVIKEEGVAIVRVNDNEKIFKDLLSILIELVKGSIKDKVNNGKLNIKQEGYYDMDLEIDKEDTIHIAITPDGAMKRLIKNDFIIED